MLETLDYTIRINLELLIGERQRRNVLIAFPTGALPKIKRIYTVKGRGGAPFEPLFRAAGS